MKCILITGALGQIGSELTVFLRKHFGDSLVVATDVRLPTDREMAESGPFQLLDVLDPNHITRVMQQYDVETIYHLGAILSAVGESKPNQAWKVNVDGLYNMLEAARQYQCTLFFPSSIGAFGAETPPDNTPQVTIQRPTTIYGITKVTGELLCEYYFRRFGVDTRGLRFPGLISHETVPGGGTTDYAVEIFYQALDHKQYTCYLEPDSSLDMMYMPDAVRAMIELMSAESKKLINRNAYNLSAMNFTPSQLATEIMKHIPDFSMDYKVDPTRQTIANSWPNSIDDTVAREEWGWKPEYDIEATTKDMLEQLASKQGRDYPSLARR